MKPLFGSIFALLMPLLACAGQTPSVSTEAYYSTRSAEVRSRLQEIADTVDELTADVAQGRMTAEARHLRFSNDVKALLDLRADDHGRLTVKVFCHYLRIQLARIIADSIKSQGAPPAFAVKHVPTLLHVAQLLAIHESNFDDPVRPPGEITWNPLTAGMQGAAAGSVPGMMIAGVLGYFLNVEPWVMASAIGGMSALVAIPEAWNAYQSRRVQQEQQREDSGSPGRNAALRGASGAHFRAVLESELGSHVCDLLLTATLP